MIKFIIIVVIVIVIITINKMHLHIKWKTFTKKGLNAKRGKFGVYCYCGKQGTGKTYSVVEFLNEHKNEEIYANLKSIKHIDYYVINNFDDLLTLRNKENCIIFYDEIFTALTKHSKLNTDVLDFLSQMRKRKIIFLTTAQEWAEIPLTFRRYCRYQIDCNIYTIFRTSFLVKKFFDAENMKWSNDDNDFIAPLLELSLSKMNKKIAKSYDTFEQISNLS